jgi:long-chain acyl-CoA synthetase
MRSTSNSQSPGASSQTIAVATAYDTLGEQGLSHSLIESQAKSIFVDQALLSQAMRVLRDTRLVKSVVYNEDPSQPVNPEHIDRLKTDHPDVTIWSFTEFMKLGEELVEPVPPSPEDLMCIMYTSGSTGPPKGVLLKHSTVISAIAGVDTIIGPHVTSGERVLAYLPLAHIIEFVVETATLYWGGVLGYGSPKTLTNDSVRGCEGDLRAFKPSFMVGVPAIWETVKKGIIRQVGEPSSFRSRLFWGALSAKETVLYWGLPGAHFLDSLVFSKVKEATGGNLRLCMNGGGAIAEATQKFISLVLCPMVGGYGLTETAG